MFYLPHLRKKESPQILVYRVHVADFPLGVAMGAEVLAHVVPSRGCTYCNQYRSSVPFRD